MYVLVLAESFSKAKLPKTGKYTKKGGLAKHERGDKGEAGRVTGAWLLKQYKKTEWAKKGQRGIGGKDGKTEERWLSRGKKNIEFGRKNMSIEENGYTKQKIKQRKYEKKLQDKINFGGLRVPIWPRKLICGSGI